MGKPTGFLEYKRETAKVLPPKVRIANFNEFRTPISKEKQTTQGARCMACGVPFCQSGMMLNGMASGCPLHNLVPETNDLVYTGNWKQAYLRLSKTHSFPEFTSRVCPALCEAACTCNLDSEPVQRELTRAVQNSHCELLDSGISKHPLNTLPLLTGDALPAENAIFALDWPTFENVNPAHVAVLRNAFGALMKNAERLAALISEHIGWLALDGIRYEQAYLWAIAQELDGELFGVTEHTGPLTDWVQHLIATRENQQAERQRRFAMALDIVRDTTQYDSLVAPDASEMTPEQLGFRYTDSQGDTFIAFELKEDFPKFMTRRLGLRASDSVEFRRYLVQNGIMKTVSKNVRGRSRDSISHALICLSTGCEAGE